MFFDNGIKRNLMSQSWAFNAQNRHCRRDIYKGRSLNSEASLSGEAPAPTPCRICGGGSAFLRHDVSDRAYYQCRRCEGTFVAGEALPSGVEERLTYELHENDASDPKYRQFVGQLVEPLIERLAAGAEGLDYGCGEGPAGAAMLTEAGFVVTLYDPFFVPDQAALEREYDFIFCCEVAEHFHDPVNEFKKMGQMLRPGGIIAIMTGIEYPRVNFAKWHYRRDPTHVTFYRPETMERIAQDREWQVIFPSPNTVLFRKQDNAGSYHRS